MVEAQLDWRGELTFSARVQGHELIVTPAKRDIDVGPSPMGLLLVAYASCTSMDVISILQKKRLAVESFHVYIAGQRRETGHPKVYETMELVFTVRGDAIPAKAVSDAIALSRDRYCSVSAMVAGPRVVQRYRIESPEGRLIAEGAVD